MTAKLAKLLDAFTLAQSNVDARSKQLLGQLAAEEVYDPRNQLLNEKEEKKVPMYIWFLQGLFRLPNHDLVEYFLSF